ncbi:MAG: glutathione S-transferase family protein [Hydrogenophaga sp.]|jgi:glutathione S-transferase|uniref:glutathione S-transferase family protein n=1 Tax=Hydrogenophaga sp. TaxID=1904254 RepID=UPI00271BC4D3|nr:glutathione S-transferase family protein [Hydrogenophaga sp.]MDO9481156.1 glutathione S-transferase family protein [Hydrogenophaga sp.]MDO9568992.1 glutathione S-transferase family protein [Hydrogenophaga sp.]MDP3344392.1 glutathione S-transferase family protein [Hydrogenophaga sp.]MDP3374529.1 glutathione S-transferase family protein [Hydrogenophaga sp.]MDP3806626.1 glutathione S-transferase family protein [Hydrogenophaga sp.]
MTLKLFFAPGACSFVPHAMLELAGAAFEPVSVKLHKGEQRSPEYLALNPRGQVPVLVDGGEVVTQIVTILLHLDAQFPEAGILPASGMARTRALQTLTWMNNTVHPTFTHVFMPQKFTDDEAAQKAIRGFAIERYRELLGEIEALAAQAAPWMTGEQPGALDAYALTLLRWGGYAGINPTDFPATWDLAQRFAALPAVARAVERERLQLNVYQG